MRVTAILNLKGGVAKTATTVNMAAILAADYGKRVLVVDADSQANSTEFLGGRISNALTMANLLRNGFKESRASTMDAAFYIQASSLSGVRLIAADDSLMDLDLTKVELGNASVCCLRQLLKNLLAYEFDYVLIDCPPAFNAASAAALVAADDVVIPIKLDAFSLRGMANLMRQIQNMRKINPALKLAGLLPTMVYKSTNMQAAREALAASKLPVFPPIRRTAKVDDMTFAQEPLIKSSPKSAACIDYRRFVKAYVEGDTSSGAPRHLPLKGKAQEEGVDRNG